MKDRHGKKQGPWDEVRKEGFIRRLRGNAKESPGGTAGSSPWPQKPARGFGLIRGRTRKPPRGSNRPFDRPKDPFGSKKDPWGRPFPKPKGGMQDPFKRKKDR